jgi:type IV pilus biogenesis protein CpaD/CtpE
MMTIMQKLFAPIRCCLLVALTALLPACGSNNTPLDAETRTVIDSAAIAQIAQARVELDSFCAMQERTQMPHLIDSIKKVRLREIEAQLRVLPR